MFCRYMKTFLQSLFSTSCNSFKSAWPRTAYCDAPTRAHGIARPDRDSLDRVCPLSYGIDMGRRVKDVHGAWGDGILGRLSLDRTTRRRRALTRRTRRNDEDGTRTDGARRTHDCGDGRDQGGTHRKDLGRNGRDSEGPATKVGGRDRPRVKSQESRQGRSATLELKDKRDSESSLGATTVPVASRA
ncbi:hypothetical protein B0H16DRAFT_415097 [Mycena metata]|uniref:Uncharacterized protein n=1 Tax=Mycena metata TaxID=1033252 RepID=A0AAD7NL28_9AGAR|nr:hypothetical protein B0H16DRAFT_415097 [Mycena metata]